MTSKVLIHARKNISKYAAREQHLLGSKTYEINIVALEFFKTKDLCKRRIEQYYAIKQYQAIEKPIPVFTGRFP